MKIFQAPLSLACRKLPGKSTTTPKGSERKELRSTKKSVHEPVCYC